MGCGIQYRILQVCTWLVSWFSAWDFSLFTDPNALNSTYTPTKWFCQTSREQFYWVCAVCRHTNWLGTQYPPKANLEIIWKTGKTCQGIITNPCHPSSCSSSTSTCAPSRKGRVSPHLWMAYSDCQNFANSKGMLRDLLICGVHDKWLQQHLRLELDLMLKNAMELC